MTDSMDEQLKSWAYPSLAASGRVEVELPSLPGSPRPTEMLHARDFGGHVAGKIEASLKGNPYKSGPQQNPAQTFNHYIAVAKGSQLMHPDVISRMDKMGKQFDKAADQRDFFNQTIRPYLNSLRPQRREK